MMRDAFLAFWFFLPAGLANMSPVFASRIPILKEWKYPIDGYKYVNGRRILGNHKTYRGLIIGVSMGVIIAVAEQFFANHNWVIVSFVPTEVLQINAVLLGFLLGSGALVGDCLKSYLKRRKGIPEGRSWFPFDQLDYIIGGVFFSMLVIILSPTEYLWIIIIYFGLHLLMSYIGFLFHLKSDPI